MDDFLKRSTQLQDEELELWHLIQCVHRGRSAKKVLECLLYAKKSIRLVGYIQRDVIQGNILKWKVLDNKKTVKIIVFPSMGSI